MDKIDIENIDLNNSYFHFTEKENLTSIQEKGLIAQIGDASELVEDKPRVCLSLGGKGILGIKNSFIHKFKNLRICDIPNGYRKYFSIADFNSTELINTEEIYNAMEKRFKNEVYLIVDAKEGEDFLPEEIHGFASDFDIKGKENHNIPPNKISILTTSKGNSALNVIQYIYNRLLTKNPGKENLIKNMNSDLSEMLDYINQRDKRTISMKNVVSKAIRDGISLEDLEHSNVRDEKEGEISKDE